MRSASRRVRDEDLRPQTQAEDRPAMADLTPWIGLYEMAWTETMKWMESWQQECQRYWMVGFGLLGQQGRPAGDHLRRVSDMPWMPRVEAAVIPLRRSTDPPGAEGTRISMRLPMPWSVAGAEIIAINRLPLSDAGRGAGGAAASERASSPPSREDQA